MATTSRSPAKKSGYRKQTQAEFEGKAMSAMPRWALAFCAILMALSLSVRQMGLDISSPLNRVMTAHAVSIEKAASNPNFGRDKIIKYEGLEKLLDKYEKRILKLEKWAHKPNGGDIPD
jgi:hypothetical protein